MGLDITAYQQVEYIETMEPEAWEEKYYFNEDVPPTATAFHWELVYADRAAPIVENGVYKINGEKFEFRAGSYSGYNEWREWLSETMLGVSPRAVWKNEDTYRGKPFFEIVCFSDCEGILGTNVARKLAADFAQYQEIADLHGQEAEGWYAQQYARWRKAFELAADGGFVEFH